MPKSTLQSTFNKYLSNGHMKKYRFLVFFIMLTIFGCQSKSKLDHTSLLHGDWTYHKPDNNWLKKVLAFSFEDTVCSLPFSWSELAKYSISIDTLIIDKIWHHEEYKFKIVKLASEALHMVHLTEKPLGFFNQPDFKNLELLKLERLTPKNNLVIERIGFYSSVCYGRCPSMYLEIDATGKIWFSGKAFTTKEGLYSGQIPQSELEVIKEKIKNIDFGSLQKSYDASWTDDQRCGIKIKTKGGEFESSAYGIDYEPVELRLLFDKLIRVYALATLEKDSSAVEKFKLQGFEDFRF